MFIYNITIKVDHAIVDEWLVWQKEVHIPEIMATGYFYEHRFYQLLEQDEEEGKTFVTQFVAISRHDYDQYLLQFAPGLQKKSFEKWGEHAITFRTLLQKVQ